ncbi:TPA: NAD-dependent epimerase/dehydratase family protein [Stenotrophomonas maltophilia]|jgi:nucleoside-diphosphate-sugar epimerase|uniref:Transmembrane anchor NAD-dependent epimerase/dehydratase/dehydrogenase n=3 Tax=Stenotrophomonas maltophilia TaxID=40324 RepID=B2FLW0_STRMK|nr:MULTISPECIES: NAD-dependent epimerase/dehydratase family protein [Stenotrophomonas]OMP38274.1 NAD-dependent dehydratase [Stenotrophomonas sp. KAs 5-3]AIL06766.1 3-beta hydroxysteroid dehydrogenase/isomerase family protein [Stenotrophomonas maltophilia]EKT4075203.1 NAD-dependent epimerase/dehydratase family protein [Stenotrophomonas maltophilia]EKT4082802.1 NAD-dependent epimerase/dehydratase family protein [Stenotrophomonas maltophilia]EKT4106380.1 NAD-dependent epimerase/dehydratase family
MVDKNDKIVLTGAAGLVGQNLIVEMKQQGYTRLVAIDKHAHNLEILRSLHPDVETILADLAEPGDWARAFEGARLVVQLHAQITGKTTELFVRNNLTATGHVLAACKAAGVPYMVHISSSVVNSVAKDDYTNTKREQEEMVVASGQRHCVLRPTLMFGWFDPKHLGWLSRFMARTPVFPIPGDGRFMRQPLYERDFCRCIAKCIETEPDGQVFDIVGDTRVDYVDIIRTIKRVKKLHTVIVHIPIGFFGFLLKVYSLFSSKPPFTADQLKALSAGDDFKGVDTEAVFGVKQTPFEAAIRESYTDPRYSHIVLQR